MFQINDNHPPASIPIMSSMSAPFEWSSVNWFANLEWRQRLGQPLADALGCSTKDPDSLYAIVRDEKLLRQAIASSTFQNAVFEVITAGIPALRRDPGPNRNRDRCLEDKFTSDSMSLRELKFGNQKRFLGSLDAYIGRPKDTNIFARMRDEHLVGDDSNVSFQIGSDEAFRTTPADEWRFVVSPEFPLYAGYRGDDGEPVMRQPVRIEALVTNEVAVKAGLQRAEVVAARLYTGPMYQHYNRILRNGERGKYLYTIHGFASCIIKLSRIRHISKVYRGLKGSILPKELLDPDECGVRGGTELAFLSATTDKEVALDFAHGGAGSFIFELQEGMIDRGADLAWVSQYPNEDEVVFPPLTSLEVVSTPCLLGTSLLVQLRANVNLKIKTVEELINLSKGNLLNTLDWYYDEVRNTQYGFDPEVIDPCWLDALDKYRQELQGHEGAHFNKQWFYRECVNQSLNLKEGTIHKLHILHTLSSHSVLSSDPEFQRVIGHVRKSDCALFASLEHRMRYVRVAATTNLTDDEIGDNLSNYESAWSLPLSQGSWATLLKGCDAETIAVARKSTWFRRLQRKFGSMGIVRSFLTPLFGEQAIEGLQGFEGVYVSLGTANPVWQLCTVDGTLGRKYLYRYEDRWLLGPSVGSGNADARSPPCDKSCKPYAVPFSCWETSVGGLRRIRSLLSPTTLSQKFSVDASMSVTRPASSRGETPVEQLSRVPSPGPDPSGEHFQDQHRQKSLVDQMLHLLCSNTDELWAFVGRIEAEDKLQGLHPVEVDSIALFCDLIGYTVPKALQRRIREQQIRNEKSTHFFLMLAFFSADMMILSFGVVMMYSAIHQHIHPSPPLLSFARGSLFALVSLVAPAVLGIIAMARRKLGVLGSLAFLVLVGVTVAGAYLAAENLFIGIPVCAVGIFFIIALLIVLFAFLA